MKMNEPFNSQAPHFLTRVKAYCAKVLPLVFDNSLSYYEFLGKVCHKLNECIDALNAQNLNIIEFTHMVQLEMENFEKYIDTRMTDFENGIKTEWAQYKEEINQAFDDFKTQIETEWAAEKAINEKFRNDLLNDFNAFKNEVTAKQTQFENQIKADFNTFKESVNTEIEQFEQATNTDLSAFKNTMQTQQNEFETHMVELFNNFKTTEKQARTDFESNFQQLFEQWKTDTLNALNEDISDLTKYVNEKFIEFNQSLTNAVTALQNETLAREQADIELQRQINQLTPTGSIKADTADSDGNSQLYIVNPDTQERTDIFPNIKGIKMTQPNENSNVQLYIINESGEEQPIFPNIHGGNFLPQISKTFCLSPISLYSQNINNDYIEENTSANGKLYRLKSIPRKGTVTLSDSIFSFSKNAIYGTVPDKAVDLFHMLNINVKFYSNDINAEGTGYDDALANLQPQLTFYLARYENDLFKVGGKLTTNDINGTTGTLTFKKAYVSIIVSQNSAIDLT